MKSFRFKSATIELTTFPFAGAVYSMASFGASVSWSRPIGAVRKIHAHVDLLVRRFSVELYIRSK